MTRCTKNMDWVASTQNRAGGALNSQKEKEWKGRGRKTKQAGQWGRTRGIQMGGLKEKSPLGMCSFSTPSVRSARERFFLLPACEGCIWHSRHASYLSCQLRARRHGHLHEQCCPTTGHSHLAWQIGEVVDEGLGRKEEPAILQIFKALCRTLINTRQ